MPYDIYKDLIRQVYSNPNSLDLKTILHKRFGKGKAASWPLSINHLK